MRKYIAKTIDTDTWVCGMVYPKLYKDIPSNTEYYYFFVIDSIDSSDSLLFSIRQATELIDNEDKWTHIKNAFVKVYPDSIGQSIGEKDSRGSVIYENSMVLVPAGFNRREFSHCNQCIGVVKFKNGKYAVYDNDDEPVGQHYEWGDLTVIGTKHDNSSLLDMSENDVIALSAC